MADSKLSGLATTLDTHMVFLVQFFAAVRWILVTHAGFAVSR
jgi:hypothetical protein